MSSQNLSWNRHISRGTRMHDTGRIFQKQRSRDLKLSLANWKCSSSSLSLGPIVKSYYTDFSLSMIGLNGGRMPNLTGKNHVGQVGNIVINFVYFGLISNREASAQSEPEFPLPKQLSPSHIKRNDVLFGTWLSENPWLRASLHLWFKFHSVRNKSWLATSLPTCYRGSGFRFWKWTRVFLSRHLS